jgi:hypothetical protein
MQRLLAAVLAVACVVGSTPVFARGAGAGLGHGTRGAAFRTNRLALPSPPPPAMQNRIPAPLSAPAQAPTINGPMSQPNFLGTTGAGQ